MREESKVLKFEKPEESKVQWKPILSWFFFWFFFGGFSLGVWGFAIYGLKEFLK